MSKEPVSYEPKYYERTSFSYLAKELNHKLLLNIRYPLPFSHFRARPEIDALLEDETGVTAVEVKSYPLTKSNVEDILSKYAALSFRKLIVIAPEFSCARIQRASFDSIKLISFKPNEEEIWDWYTRWQARLPKVIADSLHSGRHSFRYILSRTWRGKRVVTNQVDKRIRTLIDLTKDINRYQFPPVKILWSPTRWSAPKDLFSPRCRATQLGGFIAIDIDGTELHEAMHPCELLPDSTTCHHCLRRSTLECVKALESLELAGITPAAVCSSGNRGHHIYVELTDEKVKDVISKTLIDRGITFDFLLFDNPKSFVGFPTSLNASTMQTLALSGLPV